jgi:aminoglycoside phosphotransferase family enzyme/predicted kinase
MREARCVQEEQWPARVVETHVSTVFFVGPRVYKLKKPVRFPFVDLTERAARRRLCEREVELNLRLAPDVYLGVADIVGPDGEPWDHLVVMERLPDDRRLSLLATSDPIDVGKTGPLVEALGRLIASFHAGADRSAEIDAAASSEAVTALWDENFGEIDEVATGLLDQELVDTARALSSRYLTCCRPLFASRVAARAICDGHGDLQADDVFCLDDGPCVLDCIEFSDAFRYGDVANDVAFLVMDLERLGVPELGERFVDAYEQAAGERLPRSLLEFYVAYRAQVRCKVMCLRAAQEGLAGDDVGAEAAVESARQLLRLCVDRLERALPRLVLVGGLPGVGKSTLAAGLHDELDWVVLRSDVVRKELAGIDPSASAAAPFGAGLYETGTTDAVYDELLVRARSLLEQGQSVVLDASWIADAHRRGARVLAEATGCELVELRAELDAAVAADRLRARAAAGGDPSDATVDVARAMAVEADPWPEAVEVSTLGERSDAVDLAMRSATAVPRSGR